MFKFFDNFGRSSNWRKVRADHLIKFPYCSACGKTKDLEVHHIIPYQIDSSKELDPDNLITLCGTSCHFVFGHFMDWKSWNPNILEDSKAYYIAKKNKPTNNKYGSSYENTILHTIFNYIFDFIRWDN
jgi:hypothetical protein